MDKTELYKLLFDDEISSCESRKRLYGVSALIEKLREEGFENISEDDILEKIKKEKIELEKSKIQFRDERREYKKLVSQVARDEQLLELIKEIGQDLYNKKPFQVTPIKEINSNIEGILAISDWHSELNIDNFLNQFNRNEFIRRVDRLVAKTIQYGKRHNIRTLHVTNLGDLVSGVIHSTLRINSNEDVITQTMYISELIADILVEFAKEFQEVRFYNVIDNHSRVVADKKDSLNKENFMRIIPWHLKTRLHNKENIKIVDNELDEQICIFDVCGYTFFGVHGNYDKVSTVVQDLSLMTRQFPDYVLLSHYHHNMSDEIHGVEVIVNPCLSGVDEHSKDSRKTSKPAQKFLIFNPEDGLECTYSIRLDR